MVRRVVVRYATRINGLTDVAVTKLDVLDTLDRIAICTGYEYGRRRAHRVSRRHHAARRRGAALRVDGRLAAGTSDARRLEDLPSEARAYLDRLHELIETPITYVSVGTRRDQIIGL